MATEKNRPIAELYEMLINGDSMTDSEWLVLYERFGMLKHLLTGMGDRLYMARNEVNDRFDRINDVCRARGLLTDL